MERPKGIPIRICTSPTVARYISRERRRARGLMDTVILAMLCTLRCRLRGLSMVRRSNIRMAVQSVGLSQQRTERFFSFQTLITMQAGNWPQ